jgi:hypothetical protein
MRSKRRQLDLLAAVLFDEVLKRVPQIVRECDDEGLVLHSSIPLRFSATSGFGAVASGAFETACVAGCLQCWGSAWHLRHSIKLTIAAVEPVKEKQEKR